MEDAAPEPKQRLRSTTYALAYSSVLPQFRAIAREHGYALGVHGSMATDLDLIACPWTHEATEPEVLIEALRVAVNGHLSDRQGLTERSPARRAHGRRAWAIYLHEDAGGPYLDVSVMPRLPAAHYLTELRNFVERLAYEGGTLVSSNTCSAEEIAVARTAGRFWVDPEWSFGYVLRTREDAGL